MRVRRIGGCRGWCAGSGLFVWFSLLLMMGFCLFVGLFVVMMDPHEEEEEEKETKDDDMSASRIEMEPSGV